MCGSFSIYGEVYGENNPAVGNLSSLVHLLHAICVRGIKEAQAP